MPRDNNPTPTTAVDALAAEVRRLARLADFAGAAAAVRALQAVDRSAAATVAAEVFGDATDWLS